MRIAIVDENFYVHDIEERIQTMNKGLHIIDKFIDAKAFFKAFKMKQYDLVYLNREMIDLDNRHLINEIKSKEDAMIILLIGQPYFNYENYVVDAFQYLYKPLDDVAFDLAFSRALRYYENKGQRMVFKTYKGTYFIPVNDIIYLETAYKDYKLHTVEGIYIGSIKHLANTREKLCELDFMKIHRSYTINLRYVRQMMYHDIYLANGKIVPISRTKVKEFKNLVMPHDD